MKKQDLQLSFRFFWTTQVQSPLRSGGVFGVRLCAVPKGSHLQWVQTVFWISLVIMSLKGNVGQRPKKKYILFPWGSPACLLSGYKVCDRLKFNNTYPLYRDSFEAHGVGASRPLPPLFSHLTVSLRAASAHVGYVRKGTPRVLSLIHI